MIKKIFVQNHNNYNVSQNGAAYKLVSYITLFFYTIVHTPHLFYGNSFILSHKNKLFTFIKRGYVHKEKDRKEHYKDTLLSPDI